MANPIDSSASRTPADTGESTADDRSSAGRRSTRPWFDSGTAAGWAIRYLVPLQRQLDRWFGRDDASEACLTLLLHHLLGKEVPADARGRLRDFLLRASRTVARAWVAESGEHRNPAVDFSEWHTASPSWLQQWRSEVLTRAWRALERIEHRDREKPLYTLLRFSSAHPQETPSILAIRINTESEFQVEPETAQRLLPQARREFAAILTAEVAQTLPADDDETIAAELKLLGLAETLDRLRRGEGV